MRHAMEQSSVLFSSFFQHKSSGKYNENKQTRFVFVSVEKLKCKTK